MGIPEFRCLVHKDAADGESGVVGPFGAVHHGTFLDRDTALIGPYSLVSLHHTGLHVKMDAHPVSLLPLAGNHKIAVLELALHGGAINAYGIAKALAVHKLVKV